MKARPCTLPHETQKQVSMDRNSASASGPSAPSFTKLALADQAGDVISGWTQMHLPKERCAEHPTCESDRTPSNTPGSSCFANMRDNETLPTSDAHALLLGIRGRRCLQPMPMQTESSTISKHR